MNETATKGMAAGAVCGGGLISRGIGECPVCHKRARIIGQHSFGGYVVTYYCGRCGAAWGDGEILDNDHAKGIQFVKKNWKNGMPAWKVVEQILKEMHQ